MATAAKNRHHQQQCPSASSSRLKMARSSSATTLLDSLSKAASLALDRTVELVSSRGGGYSGGGGASTSAVQDKQTGQKYFVKSASGSGDMLKAEYLGIKEMYDTNTIRVPKPVAFGEHGQNGNTAFVIFEYLEFTGGGSQYELGQQLAQMHRKMSDNGKYGFHVDNTIGATPQPNTWEDDWPTFWDQHRLGHMLKLTGNAGLSDEKIEKLRQKTRELLSQHNPQPSLLHGDLWGGNKGFVKSEGKVVPCIFDPATYYGDREADVAMTYLFGGFSSDFYDGYESEWPLEAGHEQRRTVYNLYHILNHDVLFGGFYLNQAQGMIDQILRY